MGEMCNKVQGKYVKVVQTCNEKIGRMCGEKNDGDGYVVEEKERNTRLLGGD